MISHRFKTYIIRLLLVAMLLIVPVQQVYPLWGFDWQKIKKTIQNIKKKIESLSPWYLAAGMTGVAASVAAVGILCWKYCNHRSSKILACNQPILVGSSLCKGIQKKLSDSVDIKQVHVKSQFDGDGGGYASCGYHAIKNGILIINALTTSGKNLYQKLNDTTMVNKLFGDHSNWRKLVCENIDPNHIHSSINGDWINGTVIDRLVYQETNNKILLDSKVQLDHHECGDDVHYCLFDIIEDIEMLKSIKEISERIRKQYTNALAHHKPYIHGFIIGTMTHYRASDNQDELEQSALKGTQGDWYCVVLHQNSKGHRTYIITNSHYNNVLINDDIIKKLVHAIENTSVFK